MEWFHIHPYAIDRIVLVHRALLVNLKRRKGVVKQAFMGKVWTAILEYAFLIYFNRQSHLHRDQEILCEIICLEDCAVRRWNVEFGKSRMDDDKNELDWNLEAIRQVSKEATEG